MNNRILIIGASGFLGQSLVEELLNRGISDFGVVFSNEYSYAANLQLVQQNEINYHLLNLLTDEVSHIENVFSGYDIIFNLSGQITNPITTCFQLNSIGVKKLVDAVKKLNKKLIQVSTVGVYGTVPFADENSPVCAETTYGICKAFAEYTIKDHLDDQNYCITRLCNLYGKNQKKGIFNYLIQSYRSDRKLFFNNNGELLRYYIEVSDCAVNLINLAQSGASGIYNLLSPEQYTVKDLIQKFEDFLGIKYEQFLDPIKPYDNVSKISGEKISQKIALVYNYSITKYLEDKVHNRI